MTEKTFVIAVDFLGAGNLGDDLMVAGFVQGIKTLGLSERLRRLQAICSWDRASQSLRFPEIDWIDGTNRDLRVTTLRRADVVLGIGGTAFQVTSGEWLLQNLEEIVASKESNAPFLLVNIGSETEARRERARCQTLMRQMSSISTRDNDTLRLLQEWREDDTQPSLIPGADLANISLPEICATHPPLADRPDEVGIVLGCDTLSRADVEEVISWIIRDRRPVSWITCEVRNISGGEYRVYRRNRHRFGGFFTSRWRPRVTLLRPDYHSCSVTELIQPFARCKTIISSRYHGILAAAWSGCRVAGIARSSKVKWLCQQLDIPMLEPPIHRDAISGLQASARVVDKSLLKSFQQAALEGIDLLRLGEC